MFDTLFLVLQASPGFYAGVCLVLGLVIGSFLNVVIHRLPRMMQLEWLESSRDFVTETWGKLPSPLEQHPASLPQRPYNLMTPGSTCPACGHSIRWHENVPVLSYLRLRGRCSACQTRISPRYPVIELITGLLSAFVATRLPPGLTALAVLVMTWMLIAMTMIDFDHKLLPDQLTLPLLWLGLLLNLDATFVPLREAVIGAIAGYLSLWSVYWVFKLATGKEGMGYGDFKLLAALGAWMGWKVLPIIILLSSVVGSIVGIGMILLLGRDKQIPIAFGPYLAVAGWITLFWGPSLMRLIYP